MRIVERTEYPKIRKMVDEDGYGYSSIAKIYGVKGRQISKIANGRLDKIKPHPHKRGGLATNGSSLEQDAKDLAEVRAYLEAHPHAKPFDVELCCHMCETHAARLIKRARKDILENGPKDVLDVKDS